jgi:lipoic acid synthetase
MGLRYVVITSVDRDDLPDGGAAHYAKVVRAIKRLNPETAVEALTPDFNGVLEHVELVVDSGLEGENGKPWSRHPTAIREPDISRPSMLACEEVPAASTDQNQSHAGSARKTMRSWTRWTTHSAANVDILTLGQYQADSYHLPIERYVTPEEFEAYRREGLDKGFLKLSPTAGAFELSCRPGSAENNVGIAVDNLFDSAY